MGNPIGTIAGGVLGMITQNSRTNKQNQQEAKFMQKQFQNQQKLNQQGHDLNYEMWKKTNYPAQMAMLKEAGLNPSMMYGQGGAGGATTGSQSGGTASKGNSAQAMDIGSTIQAGLATSQIKVNEATANKLNKEAGKAGEETTSLQFKNRVAKLYGLDADIYEASNRKDEALSRGQVMFEGKETPVNLFEEKLNAEVKQVIDNSEINNETKKAQIDEKLWQSANEEIKNQAIKQNIKLSEQQEKELWHRIRQEWVKTGLKGLDTIINSVFKMMKLKPQAKRTVSTTSKSDGSYSTTESYSK